MLTTTTIWHACHDGVVLTDTFEATHVCAMPVVEKAKKLNTCCSSGHTIIHSILKRNKQTKKERLSHHEVYSNCQVVVELHLHSSCNCIPQWYEILVSFVLLIHILLVSRMVLCCSCRVKIFVWQE